MAMLIGKFHKLLQSKLLWLFFLIVIGLAFGIGGVTLRGCDASMEDTLKANAAGMLYDEPIDHRTYRRAYMNSYLAVAMAYGNIDMNARLDAYLQDAAWKRLATLKKAEQLNLQATDAEVVSAIRQHPGFADQGQFNIMRYKAFIGQFLGPLGMREADFEQYVREELAIQKCRRMVSQGILVSPAEIERTFHSISDRFTVDFFTISTDVVSNEVDVTDAEARALFDEDPELYRQPERVSVKYTWIDVEPFVDTNEPVDEEAVMAYYNENLTDYIKPEITNASATNVETMVEGMETVEEDIASTTNAPALDLTEAGGDVAETEAADEASDDFMSSLTDLTLFETDTVETLYYPLEDVRDDIVRTLRLRAAREKARERAIDWVTRMVPDREGDAESFDEVIEKENLPVETTELFALYEDPEVEDAPFEFNQTAFALRDNIDEYFSDPLIGETRIFVLALNERQESDIPEFEDVADVVREDAFREQLGEALESYAGDVIADLRQKMDEDTAFTNAAAALGYAPDTRTDFSASSNLEMEEEEDAYLMNRLMRAAVGHNAGEFTDPIRTEDGIMIAYVRDRTPGDPASLFSIRDQIIESVRRERTGRLFEEWQESLLEEAGFERITPGVAELEEDEETADEPEGVSAESESDR